MKDRKQAMLDHWTAMLKRAQFQKDAKLIRQCEAMIAHAKKELSHAQ